MTLGEKIKYIRKFRNMTQQELGEAIGLDSKGADNRIAQYECNYRVPKKDMLYKMAEALKINSLHFISEQSGSAEDIMQTFFWLEEDNQDMFHLFQLKYNPSLDNLDNTKEVYYHSNIDLKDDLHIGMSIDYGLVNDFMKEWMIKKQELKNNDITRADYFEWKLTWANI